MAPVKDIKGQRFGRLVVFEKAKKNKSTYISWRCVCDCGNKVTVIGKNLRNGNTKSCGCLNIDRIKERSRAKLKGKKLARIILTGRVVLLLRTI